MPRPPSAAPEPACAAGAAQEAGQRLEQGGEQERDHHGRDHEARLGHEQQKSQRDGHQHADAPAPGGGDAKTEGDRLCGGVPAHSDRRRSFSLGSSRGGIRISRSAPARPSASCVVRSRSALISAPSRMATLVIHSHTRKMMTLPSVP